MRQSIHAYSTRTLQSLEAAAVAKTTAISTATLLGTTRNNKDINGSQEEEEELDGEEQEEEEEEEEEEERVGREAERALEAVLQGRRARSPVDWDRWALSGA